MEFDPKFVGARRELHLPRLVPELLVFDADDRGTGGDVDLRGATAVGAAVPARKGLAFGLDLDLRTGYGFAQGSRDDDRQLVRGAEDQLDLPHLPRSQLDCLELGRFVPVLRFGRPRAGHEVLETEPPLGVGHAAGEHVRAFPQARVAAGTVVPLDRESHGDAGNAVSAVVEDAAVQGSSSREPDEDRLVVVGAQSRSNEQRVAGGAYAEVGEFGRESGDSKTAVRVRCGRPLGGSTDPAPTPGLDDGAGYQFAVGAGDDAVDLRAGDQGEVAEIEVRLTGRHFDLRGRARRVLEVGDAHLILARRRSREHERALVVRRRGYGRRVE